MLRIATLSSFALSVGVFGASPFGNLEFGNLEFPIMNRINPGFIPESGISNLNGAGIAERLQREIERNWDTGLSEPLPGAAYAPVEAMSTGVNRLIQGQGNFPSRFRLNFNGANRRGLQYMPNMARFVSTIPQVAPQIGSNLPQIGSNIREIRSNIPQVAASISEMRSNFPQFGSQVLPQAGSRIQSMMGNVQLSGMEGPTYSSLLSALGVPALRDANAQGPLTDSPARRLTPSDAFRDARRAVENLRVVPLTILTEGVANNFDVDQVLQGLGKSPTFQEIPVTKKGGLKLKVPSVPLTIADIQGLPVYSPKGKLIRGQEFLNDSAQELRGMAEQQSTTLFNPALLPNTPRVADLGLGIRERIFDIAQRPVFTPALLNRPIAFSPIDW